MEAELKLFVKEALLQIVEGIREAQIDGRRGNATINPKLAEKRVRRGTNEESSEDIYGNGYRLDKENLKTAGVLETVGNRVADMVEFDIAITTTVLSKESDNESNEKKAGLAIKIVSLSGQLGESKSLMHEESGARISRIKFKIPVAFPIN